MIISPTEDQDAPTFGGNCKWHYLKIGPSMKTRQAPFGSQTQAALHHQLLTPRRNQPSCQAGQKINPKYLHITLCPPACYFSDTVRNYSRCQTLCSSAAHVGITGIVSYGIQITSTFLFVERQKRKHRSLRHGGILWPTTTGCKQLFDVYIMHGFKNKQVHSFIKRNTLNLK